MWVLAAVLPLVLGCHHSGPDKTEGISSTWGWVNYRESGLVGCPLWVLSYAAMTPAHEAGNMPTAQWMCSLYGAPALWPLPVPPVIWNTWEIGTIALLSLCSVGGGGLFHVASSLPFCSGWWCQCWLITCLLHRPLPVSPEAPVLHKAVIQWWELGTKIENQ